MIKRFMIDFLSKKSIICWFSLKNVNVFELWPLFNDLGESNLSENVDCVINFEHAVDQTFNLGITELVSPWRDNEKRLASPGL